MRLVGRFNLTRHFPYVLCLPCQINRRSQPSLNHLFGYPLHVSYRMTFRVFHVQVFVHGFHHRQRLHCLICQAHVFCHLNLQKTRITQRSFGPARKAAQAAQLSVSRQAVCVSKLTANVFAASHDVAGINPQAGAGDAEHCNPLYAGYRHSSDALAGHGVVPSPPVAPGAAWPVLFVKRIDNCLFLRSHG